MEDFINSFFGTNILYIIFVVLISISVFNTRKEKYNDDLKKKINFNIKWSFFNKNDLFNIIYNDFVRTNNYIFVNFQNSSKYKWYII